MKIIISPAKSLDFETKAPTDFCTQPQLISSSSKINKELKKHTKKEIAKLMKISDALAALNDDRNRTWSTTFTLDNSKQAVFAFTGEVYRGLDVTTISKEDYLNLQDKLRILSGLYGLLKPFDLIQPYRLEMGTKLKVNDSDNLYQFWGDTLVNMLNKELSSSDVLVNLASNEYSKAVPKQKLKAKWITPVFKELKGDTYKTIAVYAKKARGLMTRYIIEENIETIESLKGFDKEGYAFSEVLSTETDLVFTR